MLSDAIGWALPELRAEAEQNMTSTCTIREKSTASTTDPDTGEVTPIPGAVVYSGKCRVRPAGQGASSAIQVGGAEAFAFDYLVSMPFAATGIAEGQQLTVDSSLDPALAGVAVEIQKVDRGDQITARRLACSEVA